uniref:DUF223 domain-containing protein n=1 Tax=Aegilops tauschii subsp. strangulata TaxID=200361 RepID=A0A453RV46_AEGTS
MAYDMLDAINNGKDSWKVKVRVISLWDVVNLNNNELISLDMTLLDEQAIDPRRFSIHDGEF